MRRPPRAVLIVPVALVVGGLIWFAWPRPKAEGGELSGYIEGETLQLAAPSAGVVARVSVERGQRVEAGAPLFVMDARTVGAQQAEAQAGVAQSRSQIATAEAVYRQASAAAEAARAVAVNARSTANRYAALRRADPGAIAAIEVERTEAEARSTAAQALAAARQAAAARTQIEGARAQAERAGAGVAELGVRADLLAPRAPAPGRIEEVYFQTGEWAGANQPVVSLLPDARVKLRFFVPETSVAAYRLGQRVRFRCDGCGAERAATISYVSPRAEFTPPVIYSRDSRDRLVFMVEARPEAPAQLTPGLPVDVTPLEPRR